MNMEVKSNVVSGIAHLRREWEKSAEGESLTNIQGNVGLVLVDVVNVLGLTPDEQAKVLGSHLYREVLPYLLMPVAGD